MLKKTRYIKSKARELLLGDENYITFLLGIFLAVLAAVLPLSAYYIAYGYVHPLALYLLFWAVELLIVAPIAAGIVRLVGLASKKEEFGLVEIFFAFSSVKNYFKTVFVVFFVMLPISSAFLIDVFLGNVIVSTAALIIVGLLTVRFYGIAHLVLAENEGVVGALRTAWLSGNKNALFYAIYFLRLLPLTVISIAAVCLPLLIYTLPYLICSYAIICRITLDKQNNISPEERSEGLEEIMNKTNREKYYITTAIAYASRKPHFGNTYEVIATDAIARYKRAMGYDVFFCTGTDEHGQKIEDLAKEQGITPQSYVDGVAGEIKGVWDKMHTSYDYFIRTTDDYHVKTVQKIFEKFLAKGDIYKGYYEGYYCTPCESFFTETQAEGGKCPDCGRPVTKAREEAYFFNMNKYADRLIKYIEDNPDFIQPEARKKEMVNNFLKAGLQDLCVSRTSFEWGIPVVSDPKHVVYVWLDALVNYITAIGYDPDKTYDEQSEHFKKYWPANAHIIGKDILRFHTIYWPIFLMALDLPLPDKVFGHPWFNFGMDKMSKSKGNVIYADALADHFGVDGVRHYALSEMPFASDGSITYETVINRFNADLVNNLGNLVKRTLDMQKKYFDKVVQLPLGDEGTDAELKEFCDKAYKEYIEQMDTYHIADAVETLFSMFRRANKYIDETTPWVLAKDEAQKGRLGTVLYNLLEVIRRGAVMLLPLLPQTAIEILTQLNAEKELAAIAQSDKECLEFSEFIGGFDGVVAGKAVGDSKVLFARVDEAKKLAELEAERLAAIAAAAPAEEERPEKPEGLAIIGFEDFMKVELRVAKITSCEKVPKAKKLLKLQVDLGYEQRQIVSGIAKFYEPEALIGKKIIVVANLAPAKLCGIESEGMLLAASSEAADSEIRVVFLADDTPLGDRIR